MENIDLGIVDLEELRRTAEAGEEAKRILRDLERHSLAGSASSARQALPQNHDSARHLAYTPPMAPKAEEAHRPFPHGSPTQGPMQSRSQRPTSGVTSSGAQPTIRLDQSGYLYPSNVPLYGQSDQRQQEREMQPQVSQVSAFNHVEQQLYLRHEPYTSYANAVPPYASFPPVHFRPSWSSTERQLSAMQPTTAAQDFSPVPQFESQHRQHPRQRVDAGQRAQRAQHQIHGKQQQTWQRSEMGLPIHHPPSSNEVLPNDIATASKPPTMNHHIPLTSPNPSNNADVTVRKNNEATFNVNAPKLQPAMTNGPQPRPASTPSLPAVVGNQASLPPPFKSVEPLKLKRADGLTPNSQQASQGAPPTLSTANYHPYGHLAQRHTHLYPESTKFHFTEPSTANRRAGHRSSPFPTFPPNLEPPFVLSHIPGQHKPSSSSFEYPSRSPSQADKKYLARDILRALKPSALAKFGPKRPRLEDDFANSIEQAPAKRHAPEPEVGASNTSTNQLSETRANGVIPPSVVPQPSVGEQSTLRELVLLTPSEQYPSPSTQPPPPPPLALLSQPPVQPRQVPQPTSVVSASASPQTTPLLPASRPPSVQPPVPMLPAPTSTTTAFTSYTPGQHAAGPSSASASRTILPMSQTVAQPSTPFPSSASQLDSNLATTAKTRVWPVVEIPPTVFASTSTSASLPSSASEWKSTMATSKSLVRPVVKLAASPSASTSTPLPRRKPLVRSDSVPAIATLPATPPVGSPPMKAVSKTSTVQQLSSSKHRDSSQTGHSETRQQTPLFLPSPTSSPPIDIFDDTGEITISEDPLQIGGPDDTMADLNMIEQRKPKGRHMKTTILKPYVLVPRRPEYLRIYKAKQLEGRKPRVLEKYGFGSEQRSSSRLLEEPDINYADPASFDFVTDDAEREAILLSCSRISERPCKWSGCGVVMDSAAKLVKHFALEHRPRKSSKNSFVCLWQQCGKRLPNAKKLFIHLRSHATIPLSCGYKDCDESFRNPSQLVRHHVAAHRRDSPKPPATFFAPKLGPLPVAPHILPSYMVEARQVQQPSIPKERHTFLGPWVLRKIAGPVNLGIRRYNAAQPLQSANGTEERAGNQPYDFLTFPSVQYSSARSQPSKIRSLDDLDSGEVSEMANDGMVLWQDNKSEEDSSGEISESNSAGLWGPY